MRVSVEAQYGEECAALLQEIVKVRHYILELESSQGFYYDDFCGLTKEDEEALAKQYQILEDLLNKAEELVYK